MKTICLSIPIFILLLSQSLSAQKTITASRFSGKIVVDGYLDEVHWDEAELAGDFINWQPQAGTKQSRKTEVKIIYDDDAIFIGAFMEANNREEIKTELTQRDNVGNTDWMGVILDTYGNGTNGFEFIIGATGVQFDAIIGANGEDESWSEVWYSEVRIEDNGWYAELKIPYSAIRFPNSEKQDWKVNLMRKLAYSGEKGSFQYIDPEVPGFINQTANLLGVSNIKAPLRLSLSPYLTTYMLTSNDPEGDGTNKSYSYNGGLDLKYGINDAFTLDMTLVPDFGQVQSDDRVLNLSPFEIQFNENRAFFTEGTELFDRGGLFYSRRVGGQPLGHYNVYNHMSGQDSLISNPAETQLYNAAKVSGRNKSGLGIGVFNAIAGSTKAMYYDAENNKNVEIETAPLTNYSVIVVDKNLDNNSYVSFINTNVWRKGNSFYNANVTGTEFDVYSKGQKWNLSGSTSVSQLIYSATDNINGLQYELEGGKSSGNFNYYLGIEGTSKTFDSNDLGFLTITNQKDYSFSANYQIPTGFYKFSQFNSWFSARLATTYEGDKYARNDYNAGFWGQTKETWNWNMWMNFGQASHDYFEPRMDGRFLKRPAYFNMGYSITSDGRKALQVNLFMFGTKNSAEGRNYWEAGISPRYRFSDKLSISTNWSLSQGNNRLGWVDILNDESIIGLRDVTTVSNNIRMVYTFNSKMSMNTRVRHYWSKVIYENFFSLGLDGDLNETMYNNFNDFSLSLFNVDLNYVWRFAPGSDLIFNWKNSISGFVNQEDFDFRDRSYIDGINYLSDSPSTNSFSLRMIYFLNGQRLFK